MNKQKINRFKLGVFVTLGLVLFTTTVYLIGSEQNMFDDTISIRAVFRNVNGLQSGNNVRYSGIKVGTVSAIEIASDTSVQVRMIIEKAASRYIRRDAVATINSDGLVGNMMVSILPTANAEPAIADGDIIQSFSKIGANDMLQTLNVTNENAALLTADLLKITEGIIKKEGTIGMLLYDSTLARDFKQTLKNLNATSGQLSEATKTINLSMTDLTSPGSMIYYLANDTLLYCQLEQTMNNLETASKEISIISEELNEVLGGMENRENAVSTLLYDTAFMQDMVESMKNINEGTSKFNENMEALKHSFLTRRYFKKQQKSKEK